jgi:membrane protein YdbS with pleckstrin-like domain
MIKNDKIHPSHWLNVHIYSIVGLIALVAITTSTFILLISLLIAVYKYYEIECTCYSFDKKRLSVQSGVFNIELKELPMSRLLSISTQRPILYRLVGLEIVCLRFNDAETPLLLVDGIRRELNISKQMNELFIGYQNKNKRKQIIEIV